MRDIVVGHRENRHLCDRTAAALNDARALVKRREVGIQIPRKALAPGDFALGGAELAQRLAVGGDIGHDDQHVHPALKRKVFRHSQRTARRQDNRIV